MTGFRRRFVNWRKELALKEERFINSALLYAAYAQSVVSIQQVRHDFSSPDSVVYQSFDGYGGRSIGVLVYCLLTVEQVLDENPRMNETERQSLTGIRKILLAAYESPTSNAKQNVENLFAYTRDVLSLEMTNITDKQVAKTLCLSLYIFLSIVLLSIRKLNSASLFFINRFVDLELIMRDVHDLHAQAENKIVQLDEFILQERLNLMINSPNSNKTIQEHLNVRYLLLINQKHDEDKQLSLLDMALKDFIEGGVRIVNLRKEQQRISTLIPSIQSLLASLEMNDVKADKELYIGEFINQNRAAYNELMSVSSGEFKVRLEDNLRQLESPDLLQSIVLSVEASLTWITSPFRSAYRSLIPKSIQSQISTIVQTLDSESKFLLKSLALKSLNDFSTKLMEVNTQLQDLPGKLAPNNPHLKQLISEDSTEHLTQLVQINTEIRRTLKCYIDLDAKIKQRHESLMQLQKTTKVLADFIKKNDGFWVSLSNFFARFCSLLKSDTASLIDQARELQKEIERSKLEYSKELAETIFTVESMQAFEPELKNQLVQHLHQHELKDAREEILPELNREQLSELMTDTLRKLNGRGSNPLFFKEGRKNVDLGQARFEFKPFG